MTQMTCIQSSDFFETQIVYEKEIEEQFFFKICPLKTVLWSCDLVPACEDFSFRSKTVSVGNELKSVTSDAMIIL